MADIAALVQEQHLVRSVAIRVVNSDSEGANAEVTVCETVARVVLSALIVALIVAAIVLVVSAFQRHSE